MTRGTTDPIATPSRPRPTRRQPRRSPWPEVPAAAIDLLYGTVDIREVDLAFDAEGRSSTLTKQEGDAVKAGDTLATLDDAIYRQAYDLATARRDAAKAQLDLLLAGTRPEDIDQARANLDAATTAETHAKAGFPRQQALLSSSSASPQAFEDAQAALFAANAKVAQTKAALAEALAGPRRVRRQDKLTP